MAFKPSFKESFIFKQREDDEYKTEQTARKIKEASTSTRWNQMFWDTLYFKAIIKMKFRWTATHSAILSNHVFQTRFLHGVDDPRQFSDSSFVPPSLLRCSCLSIHGNMKQPHGDRRIKQMKDQSHSCDGKGIHCCCSSVCTCVNVVPHVWRCWRQL